MEDLVIGWIEDPFQPAVKVVFESGTSVFEGLSIDEQDGLGEISDVELLEDLGAFLGDLIYGDFGRGQLHSLIHFEHFFFEYHAMRAGRFLEVHEDILVALEGLLHILPSENGDLRGNGCYEEKR